MYLLRQWEKELIGQAEISYSYLHDSSIDRSQIALKGTTRAYVQKRKARLFWEDKWHFFAGMD